MHSSKIGVLIQIVLATHYSADKFQMRSPFSAKGWILTGAEQKASPAQADSQKNFSEENKHV